MAAIDTGLISKIILVLGQHYTLTINISVSDGLAKISEVQLWLRLWWSCLL